MEISVYLGNCAREADGYYGTLIGNHGCLIEWYHFTLYLHVKYSRNGAFRDTVFKTQIEVHTQSIEWYNFQ